MITPLMALCILLPLLARFLPTLCVNLWLSLKGRAKEEYSLVHDIDELKAEQAQVSMVDEFAKHAKLNRKISAKSNQLKTIRTDKAWLQMKVYWYARIALYVLSAFLVWIHKFDPVVILDIGTFADYYVVYVVAYILAFPTGVVGAIGLPVALFVSQRMITRVLDSMSPISQPKSLTDEPVE